MVSIKSEIISLTFKDAIIPLLMLSNTSYEDFIQTFVCGSVTSHHFILTTVLQTGI
jgi:hypothetical protein